MIHCFPKFLFSIFLATLVLSACQDEDSAGLILTTENVRSGSKTATEGMNIRWVDGDCIMLNGQECTVHVNSSGQARAVGYTGSGFIRGYSPVSMLVVNPDTDEPTVTLPSEYNCRYEDASQIIGLPMAATAEENSTSLMFRNLSAAVLVRVRNDCSYSLFLDSVVVSSPTYQLSGNCTIDLTSPSFALNPHTTSIVADRRVRVAFARNTVALAASGAEVRDVQVPILPVGEGDIAIAVYTHRSVEGVACDVATHTFSYSASTAALGRNAMMKAQVSISTESTKVTTVRRGEFSVNGSGKKVFFSCGNLQYAIATGKWTFAEHAYDLIEDGDVSADYAGSTQVGLFGWGTNGVSIDGRITNPTSTSKTDASYGPATGNLTVLNDWGHNPIDNGGNAADLWRCMTVAEWLHLIQDRTASTVSGKANARFVKLKINGIVGMMLFPDEFVLPSGISIAKNYINKIDASGTEITLTLAQWSQLEAAGAVFLPMGGYRDGTSFSEKNVRGYYWSSDYANGTQAKVLMVKSGSTTSHWSNWSRSCGSSVRLVQEVK